MRPIFQRLSQPAILNVALFLFFPLAIFVPKGIVVLFGAVAVACLFGGGDEFKSNIFKTLRRPIVIGVGAMAAWGALSSLWSIDPLVSVLSSGKLISWGIAGVLVTAAFGGLTGFSHGRARWHFVLGMVLGLVLLTVELVFGGVISGFFGGDDFSLTRLNRGATVLSLLAFPFLWMVWRLFRSLLGVLILYGWMGGLIVSMGCDTAKVAFCVSTAIFALVIWDRKWTPRIMMGGLALVIMAAPLWPKTLLKPDFFNPMAHYLTKKPSFYHRLYIYEFVGKKIHERPFLGWGLDGARHQTFAAQNRPHLVKPGEELTLMPTHPHNAALQIWMELGFQGAVLFCFIVMCFPWMILSLRPDGPQAAVSFAALTSGLISAFVSFGVWQHWWLSSLWLGSLIVGFFVLNDDRGEGELPS